MIRVFTCWLVVRAALVVTVLAAWVVRRLMGVSAARMLRTVSWDLDSAAQNLKRWI